MGVKRNLYISKISFQFSSVQFSCPVMSDSLQPHGLQHTRSSCPSPTPEAYSNSCPSRRWCHSAISSSVIPFSSCLQSFPASGSFLMSRLFSSGGQNIGASASSLYKLIGSFPGGLEVKDLPASAGGAGRSLVREDSTCGRASKPARCSYWGCMPRARAPQQQKPLQWVALLPWQSSPLLTAIRESLWTTAKTQHGQRKWSCSVVSDSLRPHGL